MCFGDGDFYSNSYFAEFGNGDMVSNAVDWTAAQEDLITLTPRTATERFILPPQGYVVNLIALITLIIIPGFTLVSGIVVFLRRRRRA